MALPPGGGYGTPALSILLYIFFFLQEGWLFVPPYHASRNAIGTLAGDMALHQTWDSWGVHNRAYRADHGHNREMPFNRAETGHGRRNGILRYWTLQRHVIATMRHHIGPQIEMGRMDYTRPNCCDMVMIYLRALRASINLLCNFVS